MIDIARLHMALRFKAERVGVSPGHALAELRTRIAREMDDADNRLPAARFQMVYDIAERLLRYSPADMPPPTDDVALVLDAICFRHGYTVRADAWRHIGINPNRGRDLLARSSGAVDWPIWFTMRHAALGE